MSQPAGFTAAIDSVGTASGSLSASVADQFVVQLAPGVNGLNYNYGEQPAATGSVQQGQAAGIGFWNNKNGQALILALNGGGASHELGDWLRAIGSYLVCWLRLFPSSPRSQGYRVLSRVLVKTFSK
jgi:hypothetical protein